MYKRKLETLWPWNIYINTWQNWAQFKIKSLGKQLYIKHWHYKHGHSHGLKADLMACLYTAWTSMSYPMKFRLIEVLPSMVRGTRICTKQHLEVSDNVGLLNQHSNCLNVPTRINRSTISGAFTSVEYLHYSRTCKKNGGLLLWLLTNHKPEWTETAQSGKGFLTREITRTAGSPSGE